ncbi:MAG: hypothetical protein ABIO70_01755 [Pseudomonadota bacterium]
MMPLLTPLLFLAAVRADPPAEVLVRLDEALGRLADPAQVDHFRVTTEARTSDMDGADAHLDVVVVEIGWDAAGAVQTRPVSHTRDGAPIPEEEPQDGKKGEVSVGLAAPAGEALARYTYGPTEARGAMATAPFAPAPGEPAADDLASGTLCWDPCNGRPLWIEMSPVELPMFVKALQTRIVLGESQGHSHTARIVVTGHGGIPGFRKQMAMEMRFHDVVWKP